MNSTERAHELCTLSELPDGEARGFDLLGEGKDTMFVVRRGEALHGYRNWCPHQGATMPWKKHAYLNADRSLIVCFAHGAEFDIATGDCVRGAALGCRLRPVALSVAPDGRVLAHL